MKLIIGVDEVGRGPLAGPVTLCAFAGDEKIGKWILKNIFKGKLKDSKKLSHYQRVAINRYILKLKKEGKVDFAISHISNKIIDKKGISYAIQWGIRKCLKNLTPNPSPKSRRGEETKSIINRVFNRFTVMLDGGLKAPEEFKNQKTIIKGDEKNVFIACASIVAKVTRDRLMCRLAKKYPEYGFEVHRGYGTKKHLLCIKKYNFSPLHRTSFCKRV